MDIMGAETPAGSHALAGGRVPRGVPPVVLVDPARVGRRSPAPQRRGRVGDRSANGSGSGGIGWGAAPDQRLDHLRRGALRRLAARVEMAGSRRTLQAWRAYVAMRRRLRELGPGLAARLGTLRLRRPFLMWQALARGVADGRTEAANLNLRAEEAVAQRVQEAEQRLLAQLNEAHRQEQASGAQRLLERDAALAQATEELAKTRDQLSVAEQTAATQLAVAAESQGQLAAEKQLREEAESQVRLLSAELSEVRTASQAAATELETQLAAARAEVKVAAAAASQKEAEHAAERKADAASAQARRDAAVSEADEARRHTAEERERVASIQRQYEHAQLESSQHAARLEQVQTDAAQRIATTEQALRDLQERHAAAAAAASGGAQQQIDAVRSEAAQQIRDAEKRASELVLASERRATESWQESNRLTEKLQHDLERAER
jgi:hypothetical protein